METKLLSLGGFLTLGRGLNDVGEMLFCTLFGVREHFWPPLTGCQYEFSLSEPNIAEHHPAPPRVEVENRCSASGLTLCSSCLYVCICVCMCACLHVCAHLHTLVWNIYVCVFHKDAASPTHITKKSTEERDLCSQPRPTLFSWDCKPAGKSFLSAIGH